MRYTRLIKTLILFVLITAFGHSFAIAQYPFEKYKAIKYKRVKFKVRHGKNAYEGMVYYSAKLPGIGKGKSNYSILIKGPDAVPFSAIYIKKNNKIFQKIQEPANYSISGLNYLYIADINSDSLPDIKFTCENVGGCGIGGEYRKRIYLFQKPNGKFNKISFEDLDINDSEDSNSKNYWPERDLDNNGKYVIITCRLCGYRENNYWTFDIYEYKNGDLICVDNKYNYPIMIQYLYRDNYEITKRISPQKMRTFKRLKPDGYDKR
jgi:hypothetical protein